MLPVDGSCVFNLNSEFIGEQFFLLTAPPYFFLRILYNNDVRNEVDG